MLSTIYRANNSDEGLVCVFLDFVNVEVMAHAQRENEVVSAGSNTTKLESTTRADSFTSNQSI